MPLFIDIHEVPGVTTEIAAAEHIKDIEIQTPHGVNFSKYWINERSGKIFCLCEAPSAEAAMEVHRMAHGGVGADRIIEVTPELTEMFMGDAMTDASGAVLLPAHENHDTATRTVLFTDLVNSTALTQTLGDIAAMQLLQVHDRIVRTAIGLYGGSEIKHTGDGIMAAFVSPAGALRCAIRALRDLHAYVSEHPEHSLQMRIGAAIGEPVEHHNDLFGTTVQLAARLCGEAKPMEILVSHLVADACSDDAFVYDELCERVLKGFEKPVPVRVVMWQIT
jgi:class 3 adenylate cyclase